METKYGFTKMSVKEFEKWIDTLRVARTIVFIQQHHTYSPNYHLFKGNNHFELQKGMKNYHVYNNGWMDIGQHFTIFPDGEIVTGRSLENTPACIYGNNSNSICIENLGNFDTGGDVMNPEQAEAILKVTAAICKKYNIPVNASKIVYHHWFNLSTGERNNGTKNNKTCPGTNFFGGNKVADCEANFLPKVKALIDNKIDTEIEGLIKYVQVTASSLSVRSKADGNALRVSDRESAQFGSVLRVFAEKNGWYKISGSKQHWVSGRYTTDVRRATVTADTLNVRNGPGASYLKISSLPKGKEVFVCEENNGWCKINFTGQWVSKDYLEF